MPKNKPSKGGSKSTSTFLRDNKHNKSSKSVIGGGVSSLKPTKIPQKKI